MNKIWILAAACVLSFVFVMMQLLILRFMTDAGNAKIFNPMELLGKFNRKRISDRNIMQLLKLEGLINATEALNLSLVLIDYTLLQDIVKDLSSPIHDLLHLKSCNHFCAKKVITFGIVIRTAKEGKKLHKLVTLMKEREFDSFVVEQTDTRGETLEKTDAQSLPTHILLRWKALLVEIILFYERKSWLWHPKMNPVSLGGWPSWHNAYIRQNILMNPYTKSSHLTQEITPVRLKIDNIVINVPQFVKTFVENFPQSTFIPCNIHTARTFVSKYGLDLSAQADVFRLKAKNLLALVKDILDSMEVPFWLSSGTCLGWFRQCDFIPHSKDVDIGIFISEFSPNIEEEFIHNGLIPKHKFGKIEDSYELSFLTPDRELKLDIFFFYEERDHIWNGGTQAKTGKKFKYIFPKFTLCWTEFVGLLVRVPCQTLSYITANYGHSWNTLVKEWDWKKSPPNVRENGVWAEEERHDVVRLLA